MANTLRSVQSWFARTFTPASHILVKSATIVIGGSTFECKFSNPVDVECVPALLHAVAQDAAKLPVHGEILTTGGKLT